MQPSRYLSLREGWAASGPFVTVADDPSDACWAKWLMGCLLEKTKESEETRLGGPQDSGSPA
eukprot:12034438-Karenia_brevis.AAC.1